MTSSVAAAGVLVLRGLRLGHLRLTAYGLCAAAGLMVSMALASHAARKIEMDPEAVWDAGMFAILCCFVTSRLLLVLGDPLAFTHYPMLVLGLPSLTFGGMAAAAVMLWAYLRRKRLPLLPLLDVFAAPGALLAGFLELGHWLDGSERGMPASLHWDASAAHLYPVAGYGVLASALIAGVLWRALLRRPALLGDKHGRAAALGLMLGGAAAFCLDMLTQPSPAIVDLLLEPGQWAALGAILAGALLWTFAPVRIPDVSTMPADADAAAATMTYLEPESMHTEVR